MNKINYIQLGAGFSLLYSWNPDGSPIVLWRMLSAVTPAKGFLLPKGYKEEYE